LILLSRHVIIHFLGVPATFLTKQYKVSTGKYMNNRLILLIILAAFGFVNAETRVAGVISKDTKWMVENGPFILYGDVLVERGVRLSISPGTTVLCGPATVRNSSIPQLDRADSFSVALKIEGSLDCTGKREKRIVFRGGSNDEGNPAWYGIVFTRAPDNYVEMAFTDVSGAGNGLTAVECSPLLRNCVIERNNVGIRCLPKGNLRVYNCVIVNNYTCGVAMQASNPIFYNNIIAFNRNNGVWCDGVSRMTFKYNCVFGNADGNYLDCDPELGIPVKPDKKSRDTLDKYFNVCMNPVFAGSADDSLAVEKDLSLPTEKSRVTDTALAKILHKNLQDSLAIKKRKATYARYSLSRYSPCINKGNPAKEFNDADGSRNDIGMYGGPEYLGK
jgi:hypothetical protein